MAHLQTLLPDEVLKEFRSVYENTEEIFGAMVEAGADVVYKNILGNMQYAFKDAGNLAPYLKKTKVYRTYGNTVINCKVAFYGYYKKGQRKHVVKVHATEGHTYKTGKGHRQTRKSGRKEATYQYDGVPVPLIVIAREYGTSMGEAKKPFLRKSFTAGAIRSAMMKAQKEASGGLLE